MSEFVSFEDDPTPHVIYKPYIYATIKNFTKFYIIEEPKGNKVVWKDEKQIKREEDPLVRDPDRIKPFLNNLGDIWLNNCPDWRFGQLIENVFSNCEYQTWMFEEDRMLEEFKNYFEKDQRKLKKGGQIHGRKRRQSS